jgi:hypothetical protein
MLNEISVAQFNEWIAFWLIEPFGGQIEDARTARVCQSNYGAQGHRATLSDFMPEHDREVKAMPSDEELREKAKRLAGM